MEVGNEEMGQRFWMAERTDDGEMGTEMTIYI